MLKNLLFTSLTSLYYAIIPVYFSAKLFPKRTNSKALISITIAVSIILLWFLHMLKLYGYESETTTLIQLIIFFNIFVLFKGSAKQKILSYFIFLFLSILAEILSINIYIQIYNLFIYRNKYNALNIYSLCNFHEKLIIELLIFALNYLFYKNVVSLLKECINYLKFTLLLLITFPVFLPLIATEVIHYAAFTNHFIPVCEDNLILVILESKRMLAEHSGINVNYQIFLPEKSLIQPTDLSSVLFNLLDNAIEACSSSGFDKPHLSLSLTTSKGFLSILVRNSKNPLEVFDHNTTKENTFYHGLGLSIIEDICRKYDGSWQWNDCENTFESIILLRYC